MSEEDIKILEKIIKEYRTFGDLDNPEFEDTEKIYNSIENLIKAYKELEEENRIFALEGCRVRLKMYIDNNYIPVSLVEEKIEKLREKEENDLKAYGFAIETHFAKQVLQELLKDEVITKAKVEEMIKKYKEMSDDFYIKFLEGNRLDKDIHDVGISCDAKVQVLEELLKDGGE